MTLIHAERQTAWRRDKQREERTDTAKAISAFHDSANAPKANVVVCSADLYFRISINLYEISSGALFFTENFSKFLHILYLYINQRIILVTIVLNIHHEFEERSWNQLDRISSATTYKLICTRKYRIRSTERKLFWIDW